MAALFFNFRQITLSDALSNDAHSGGGGQVRAASAQRARGKPARRLLAAASAVFIAGSIALSGPMVAQAADESSQVYSFQLKNVKTGKCLTIAGGTVDWNNHPAVQFDCDTDASRRWMRVDSRGYSFQLKNVKTGKCLTVAGGTVDWNNHPIVQFDCDTDASRRWSMVSTGSSFQLKNVKTSKCLTIAGGTVDWNNHPAVQFDCDTDASRSWTML